MTALSQLTSQGGGVIWPLENTQSRNGHNLRRKWVLRFLSESKIIDKKIDILESAYLKEANLEDIKLLNVDLTNANLTNANLSGANLSGANLSGANLSKAILENVDLSQAKSLTPEQLEGENPPLLCNVKLPEGFSDKFKDRDCGKLPKVPPPKSPDKQADVKPLDPKAAKEISELKAHPGSVAFSPDGQTLATSGDDETIRLWNIKGQLLKILPSKFQGNQTENRSINNSLDFSPDGQYLVSDAGGKILLWDLKSANLVTEFVASQKLLRSVKFNPKNGQQLASTEDDGNIYLWNLQGQSLAKWQADPKQVWDLEFSPDGQQIASAEASGIVSLWNSQGESLHKFTEHIPNPVLSVAFSPDGKQLVSGCNIGMIRSWWSLPNYQMQNKFDDVKNHAELNSVAYGLDGKLIVSGDNKGYIRLWKVNNQQPSPFWTSPDQKSNIRKVAFSLDGIHFATADGNGIVKLWQLE